MDVAPMAVGPRGYISANLTDIAGSVLEIHAVAEANNLQDGSIAIDDLQPVIEVDRHAVADMFRDHIAGVADRFALRGVQIGEILSLFVPDIVVVEEVQMIDGHGCPKC